MQPIYRHNKKTYKKLESFQTPGSGFSLFECYRQKIGLIFSKQNSVLISLKGRAVALG